MANGHQAIYYLFIYFPPVWCAFWTRWSLKKYKQAQLFHLFQDNWCIHSMQKYNPPPRTHTICYIDWVGTVRSPSMFFKNRACACSPQVTLTSWTQNEKLELFLKRARIWFLKCHVLLSVAQSEKCSWPYIFVAYHWIRHLSKTSEDTCICRRLKEG